MIKRVLIIVFIVFVLGIALLWLIEGGGGVVARTAKSFGNPIGFLFGGNISGGSITLPGQPAYTQGVDISQYVGQADQLVGADAGSNNAGTASSQQDASTLGTPSPYQGRVSIMHVEHASDAAHEFIELDASYDFTSPITISGWALQSGVTGARYYLPEGAKNFSMGIVNNVGPVTLSQGGSAIVVSGASPVGVSFEENQCSGYLAQVRSFTPEMPTDCPAPSQSLQETPGNLQLYGASCFDYLSAQQGCYAGTPPASLTSACRTYIENTFTYNGCLNLYRGSDSFALPTWRLFLNSDKPLWGSHDVIRLLDSRGRIVNSLTY